MKSGFPSLELHQVSVSVSIYREHYTYLDSLCQGRV